MKNLTEMSKDPFLKKPDPTLKEIEKWCGASKYKDDVVTFVLLMVCLFGFAFFGYLIYFVIISF